MIGISSQEVSNGMQRALEIPFFLETSNGTAAT